MGDLFGGPWFEELGDPEIPKLPNQNWCPPWSHPKRKCHLVFQSHPFFQVLLLAVKFQGGFFKYNDWSEDNLLEEKFWPTKIKQNDQFELKRLDLRGRYKFSCKITRASTTICFTSKNWKKSLTKTSQKKTFTQFGGIDTGFFKTCFHICFLIFFQRKKKQKTPKKVEQVERFQGLRMETAFWKVFGR